MRRSVLIPESSHTGPAMKFKSLCNTASLPSVMKGCNLPHNQRLIVYTGSMDCEAIFTLPLLQKVTRFCLGLRPGVYEDDNGDCIRKVSLTPGPLSPFKRWHEIISSDSSKTNAELLSHQLAPVSMCEGTGSANLQKMVVWLAKVPGDFKQIYEL